MEEEEEEMAKGCGGREHSSGVLGGIHYAVPFLMFAEEAGGLGKVFYWLPQKLLIRAMISTSSYYVITSYAAHTTLT